MPLINITLIEGKPQTYLTALGDGIHESLMETWGIPKLDRFHIFHEKKKEHFDIDRKMWNVDRSDDLILLQITTSPRTKEMKLTFYEHLPKVLNEKIQLRPEDIFITIVTANKEDWTFGNGKAQLLEL